MNYIRGNMALEVFGVKDPIKVKLINFIIEICKRNNFGKILEKQRISFNSEDMEILKKISELILWIYDNECRNFRTLAETEELVKTLIDSIKNNKPVLFFALFCPGYKKGENVYGFNHFIGGTTTRGISNLFAIFEKVKSIGISCEAWAIYADLALENINELKKEDLEDLEKNFVNFKKYGMKTNPSIKYLKLSEIGECEKLICKEGALKGKINLNKKEILRISKRSFPFYKEVLGWDENSIIRRTEDLARSCSVMADEIRNKNSLLVKVMTENIYERAKLYQGSIGNKTLPIFYPEKYKQ